jgi:RNA polymerase sigma factor (sigma-70 family)
MCGAMTPRDADRFREMYDRFAPDLLKYILRRVPRQADAPDVLADVFLVAWRRIEDVPPEPETRLWLYGVARLTLQNEHRRTRRRDALADRLRSELHETDVGAATESDDVADVRAALDVLSGVDRELVVLTAWDGLSPSEAAAVLGLPPQIARVRLHRARRRLQKLVAAQRDAGDGHVHASRTTVVLAGVEETT